MYQQQFLQHSFVVFDQHLWCNHGDSQGRWTEPRMAMTKTSGQTDTPYMLHRLYRV